MRICLLLSGLQFAIPFAIFGLCLEYASCWYCANGLQIELAFMYS